MTMNQPSEAFTGIHYFTKGLRVAFQKGMRLHILVPITLNIVLFSVMTLFLLSEINSWLTSSTLQVTLPAWLSLLQPVIDFVMGAAEAFIWIVIVVAIILLTTSSFTALTNLIAAPFNGYLAERAEAQQRPINYPSLTVSQLVNRTLRRELTKLRYWLTRLVQLFFLTLLIGFIPLINALSPLIWFAFGAWMLSIQYIDYAADNNGLSFDETLQRLHQHRAAVFSFGLVIMCITLLPLINLVIVPIAICGATLLWVDRLDCQPEHLIDKSK